MALVLPSFLLQERSLLLKHVFLLVLVFFLVTRMVNETYLVQIVLLHFLSFYTVTCLDVRLYNKYLPYLFYFHFLVARMDDLV